MLQARSRAQILVFQGAFVAHRTSVRLRRWVYALICAINTLKSYISLAWTNAGLAALLGYGAAAELLRLSTNSEEKCSPSLMMTEDNIERLVAKLTQLRTAALKLGQFMSIKDSHVLPPEFAGIFRRVQDSAHCMPDWQMEVYGCPQYNDDKSTSSHEVSKQHR
ncbi:uncharacterized protein LAESUDRAFT_762377 [Laetiporus sulphureus 93-53]|uniref:Uncharacterized protein n=1 Tax=Laetiporus sulphureus 93-53 TaxID=1314785 RepID=A0A165CK19_9APHY|nr:uncharacterized protein LAESUDRAFT_762377 [Laetiporus sulphureus 93-53]KZT02953.1 hypothetical protein LAESUDRAFT_762377 [Laetiporus sulphureus 93-53]